MDLIDHNISLQPADGCILLKVSRINVSTSRNQPLSEINSSVTAAAAIDAHDFDPFNSRPHPSVHISHETKPTASSSSLLHFDGDNDYSVDVNDLIGLSEPTVLAKVVFPS